MDNYSSPEFILSMDYALALQIVTDKINFLTQKEINDKRWQLYLTIYPHMLMGKMKRMEFDDFCKTFEEAEKKQVTVADYSHLTDEEMLREIEELEKSTK